MIPVLGIVGHSNVGKTTLTTKIIKELKKLGYRVGTIKHDIHGFDIDKPGKDTWKHAQAGADTVIIASPNKTAIIIKEEKPKTLDQLISLYSDIDIIIVEGFKKSQIPKIEVIRKAKSEKNICNPKELLAIATDVEELEINVPKYHIDDIQGIIRLIKKRIIN